MKEKKIGISHRQVRTIRSASICGGTSERASAFVHVSIAKNSRRAAAADVTRGCSRAALRNVSHRGRRDDAPWTSPSPPPSSSSLPPGSYSNRRRERDYARDARKHVLLDSVLIRDGLVSTTTRRRPGALLRGRAVLSQSRLARPRRSLPVIDRLDSPRPGRQDGLYSAQVALSAARHIFRLCRHDEAYVTH